MTITDAPKNLISRCNKLWPGAINAMGGLLPDSGGSVRDMAAELLAGRYGMELHIAAYEAPMLAAAFLWSKSPNIYRFFGAFSASLADYCDTVSVGDVLPVEALSDLRHPCCFLYAPGVFSSSADGCLCFLDSEQGQSVLVSVYPLEESGFFSAAFPLSAGTQFDKLMPDMVSLVQYALLPASAGHAGAMAFLTGSISVALPYSCPVHNSLLRIAQHALYLVSDRADIQKGDAGEGSDITFYDVGFQMTPPEAVPPEGGRSPSDGTGGTKRGHFRRAHWHSYWVRNERGEKVLTPRWVEAVYVGGKEDS